MFSRTKCNKKCRPRIWHLCKSFLEDAKGRKSAQSRIFLLIPLWTECFLCLRFDEFLLGKKSREMREAGNCDKDKVLSHYFLETRRSKHIFKRGIIKQKADLVAQMRIVSPHFALNNSQESNKIMIMNLSFSFRINWTEEENNFETIKLKKKSNKCSID